MQVLEETLKGVEVTLSPDQMIWASAIGCRRRIESIKRNLQDRFGENSFQADFWGIDVEAAGAELAASIALGVEWDATFNAGKAPDVGEYQIRHSTREDASLIIRPDDKDDEYFILVTGKYPTYRVIGKIKGKIGKKDCYVRNSDGRSPAWFIPQYLLQPLK